VRLPSFRSPAWVLAETATMSIFSLLSMLVIGRVIGPEAAGTGMIAIAAFALLDILGATLFTDALVPLLRDLHPDIAVIGAEQKPDAFDLHAPLHSLPLAFGTTLASIPTWPAYLKAPAERVARWASRLGSEGLKIGINWQGSTGATDVGRSFPLSQFLPLAQLPGVRLISLHKGAGEAQLQDLPAGTVETLGADFDAPGAAFLDSAAVLQLCDVVITSDTSLAHLAGALGVPTWVILQRVPDWRWLLGREDSPWYPSLRLFRQEIAGDWDQVFGRILDELRARPGRHTVSAHS
jgi:hypothetical protein